MIDLRSIINDIFVIKFSLSSMDVMAHIIIKTVLHGVERTILLGPHEGEHPCLPGKSGLHHVLDRAEDFFVAGNRVLDACLATSESVLLENFFIRLNCVEGNLQLVHFIIQRLPSHLNHFLDFRK
jgi:hypothetical protein